MNSTATGRGFFKPVEAEGSRKFSASGLTLVNQGLQATPAGNQGPPGQWR